MPQLHEPTFAAHLDGLAGQPRPCVVMTVAKPMVPLALTRLVVVGSWSEPVVSTGVAGASPTAANLNRSKGGIRSIDSCGRWWL